MAHIARDVHMELNNCRRVERDIIILDENNLLLKEKLGIEVNGIIGGSYFSNLVVKINYARNRLTLYNPTKFKQKDKKFQEYPLEISSNKPYLTTTITTSDNSKLDVTLLLDTGAALPFLLHTNTDSSLTLPQNAAIANVGFGLSGVVKGYIGRTRKLSLGEYFFDNISTSYQDVLLEQEQDFKVKRNGLIGNNLLRRFIVIIDYSKERLYLRASRKYNRAFNYDRSGLTIFAIGQNLNQYYVVSVIEGSPASEAGIKPGDSIVKFGKRRTKNMKLQDISHRLSQKPDKRIKLTLERDGEQMKVEFYLKDWFDKPVN